MLRRIHKHTISFVNAIRGLAWALRTQPNYQVHIFLSTCALFASYWFKISKAELLAIIILIGVGLSVETINTAIECTNDAISLERNSAIKLAKDVSAGAMLIFAIVAATVAIMIFSPRIF